MVLYTLLPDSLGGTYAVIQKKRGNLIHCRPVSEALALPIVVERQRAEPTPVYANTLSLLSVAENKDYHKSHNHRGIYRCYIPDYD